MCMWDCSVQLTLCYQICFGSKYPVVITCANQVWELAIQVYKWAWITAIQDPRKLLPQNVFAQGQSAKTMGLKNTALYGVSGEVTIITVPWSCSKCLVQ